MTEQIRSKPLVSIISNFFNAEKYFEEAIESVFNQTYDNWELLLVDDGSTDDSTAIALRYARDHPEKVHYLEHESHVNRGRCAARDLGIRNARGEYIAFLDADDVYLPQKLEQQLLCFDFNLEVEVVFGPTLYWFSWTGKPEDTERDLIRVLNIPPDSTIYPPKLLPLLLQSKVNTPATCSVLIRRQLFDKIGGFEGFMHNIYEDVAFFAKLYHKASVFVHSQHFDLYRQHPDSTCAVAMRAGQYYSYKANPAHLAFLNWMAEYLSKEVVKDAEIWQALEKGLWPYRYSMLYLLKRQLQRIKYRWQCLRKKLYNLRKT